MNYASALGMTQPVDTQPGLPSVFNTGWDFVDTVGNAWAQYELFELQKDLLDARNQQLALTSTPSVPNQPNAQTGLTAAPPSAPIHTGIGTDQRTMTILIIGGVALAALLLLR